MPECPHCEKVLQDLQGLSGHVQLAHPEHFKKRRQVFTENQGTPPQIAGSPYGAVLSFLRARGRRRVKNCSHIKKGELTGKPLCWYWAFDDKDADGGLELIQVKGEECMRAVASPLLCGICEATDAANPKKRVGESESRQ